MRIPIQRRDVRVTEGIRFVLYDWATTPGERTLLIAELYNRDFDPLRSCPTFTISLMKIFLSLPDRFELFMLLYRYRCSYLFLELNPLIDVSYMSSQMNLLYTYYTYRAAC